MASCTQIDTMLQAYIDGALGQAERVILEQHVGECGACQRTLRQQQRTSAMMFEVFSDQRLGRDLSKSIRENLPELEFGPVDVVDLNMRAKHPSPWRETALKLVPVAAAALLIVMGMVIREYWPQPSASGDAFGLVTYEKGHNSRYAAVDNAESKARLKTFVMPGDVYETSKDSQMMLTLEGPTQVRLNEQTRVRVYDHRKMRVERGEVLLDVARDARLFKVLTPTGTVTVYGTSFDVAVTDSETRVAVEKGEVMVEHAENEGAFRELRPGQEVTVRDARSPMRVVEVSDPSSISAWAREIEADTEAADLFANRIQPRHKPQFTPKLDIWQDYSPSGMYQSIDHVTIEWEPVEPGLEIASYDVFVTRMGDSRQNSLFRGRIDGDAIESSGATSIQIPNNGNRDQLVKRIWVRFEPDLSTGSTMLSFKRVDFQVPETAELASQ